MISEADAARALPKFNSDGTKVTSKGLGLNKAFVNKKAQFTVDTSSAGKSNALYSYYRFGLWLLLHLWHIIGVTDRHIL